MRLRRRTIPFDSESVGRRPADENQQRAAGAGRRLRTFSRLVEVICTVIVVTISCFPSNCAIGEEVGEPTDPVHGNVLPAETSSIRSSVSIRSGLRMSGWTDERTGLAMVSASWVFESTRLLWLLKRADRLSVGRPTRPSSRPLNLSNLSAHRNCASV
jgi:hypothetical protein